MLDDLLLLCSWQSSFKTLFWNIFGKGGPSDADVVVTNVCFNDTEMPCMDVNKHAITEGTGYFLYGLYHLIMVVVLLNMLIALMANVLTKIQVQK